MRRANLSPADTTRLDGVLEEACPLNEKLALFPSFGKYRIMESDAAITSLSALGQPVRLDVFRLLIRNEPNGRFAGDIAKSVGVPASTLSSHLAVLERAGLATATKDGRTITYRANIDHLRELILFLVADCCGGEPDRCESLLAELLPCC